MNYLTNYGTSQSQIGHTRPRLYSLPELMEELGEPFGVLRSLITRYKIRSPFEKSGHGPKQYRLVDFQNALAQDKGIEARIEKDVPLPPRGHGTASKYRPILDAMGGRRLHRYGEVGGQRPVPVRPQQVHALQDHHPQSG